MKTAVEWFATELNNWRIKEFGEDAIIGIPQDVFDQAKEMEKEQIIKAVDYCLASVKLSDDKTMFTATTAEQYYNETFKSE